MSQQWINTLLLTYKTTSCFFSFFFSAGSLGNQLYHYGLNFQSF